MPNGVYNEIQRRGNTNSFLLKEVVAAIKSGIVLPEVHGDIKDADVINKLIDDSGVEWFDSGALNTAINAICKADVLVPSNKQKCPYCEQVWHWSNDRRLEYYEKGTATIKCRRCKGTFIVDGYNKAIGFLKKERYR